MISHTTTAKAPFTLTYEFDAPKKMVFEAFGNAEALNEWWGPVEAKNTVISLDFRPGGIFHYKMDFNGHIAYGRMLFGAINRYDLLEINNAFADENANPVPAPFEIKIPTEIFYRLIFTEENGKTTITMTGEPVNANAEELAGFTSIDESMRQGFGATFFKLAHYLGKK
jgi:uncharacterized protein YndB with AHSA1/START domain